MLEKSGGGRVEAWQESFVELLSFFGCCVSVAGGAAAAGASAVSCSSSVMRGTNALAEICCLTMPKSVST